MPLENREREFEVFKAAIARLHHASGSIVGAGFLVSDRYLLTCAHVVTAALGIPQTTQEIPPGFVELDFPLIAPGQKVRSRVVFWQPVNQFKMEEDIAGLVLEDSLPNSVKPLRLIECGNFWRHEVGIFGFPKGHVDGIWATGSLRDKQARGWVHIEVIAFKDRAIEKGFSGAPVWDEELKGVVGMVVAAEKRREDVTAAFMIPTSILSSVWSELRPRIAIKPTELIDPTPLPPLGEPTSSQKRRLEKQQKALQEEWYFQNEKLKQLRLDLAIKTGTAVKFQLQQQIQAEEMQLERLAEKLDKLEQPLSSIKIVPQPSITSLKANYDQLRTFLETKAWQEADSETIRVILQVAKKQKEGWLKAEDIVNFSCSDIWMIDQLWLDASKGQFGFSVQRKIWLSVNGEPGKFERAIFRSFGDQVGWRINGNWLRNYEDFNFSLDAPYGHLPSLRFPAAIDQFATWQESFKNFLPRLENCF